jgi:hypothetical protein
MSLKPVEIMPGQSLRSVGNTPAICVTKSLSPEVDANLLLLGCIDESARTVLCGDLPTIALLLGVKLIQYWTNTGSPYHVDAWDLQNPPDRAGTKVPPNVTAVLWKPADLALIKYSPIDLAQLVFGLYLEMFQAEDWSKRFELLSLCNNGMLLRKRNAYNLYTRANFATILQHIKNAEVTEWTDFIRHLMIDHILKDKILHVNGEHF